MVWLDLPLRTCLWRVTRRAVSRARSGEVMWGTNRERWGQVIGRKSLAWWVITTHGRRRRETEERLADPAYANLRVHRFRSSKAADAWAASA